jgi:benzoate/toluate 1,2-dioxygenase beta subunit
MAKADPSQVSHYISDEFYQKLIDDFTGWQDPAREIADPGARDKVLRFLVREARALEELKFDDWLKLYAPECVYWVPATAGRGDPRREVAVAFDDRRRLEDRIYRLSLAHAWSQRPPSRTVRLIGNLELYDTVDKSVYMARSSFTISEFWADEVRLWAGWCGHRLKARGDSFSILAKQVNLIDCDQNLRNPSIVF